MGIPVDIQIHAWIPFEVCLIAYGGLHEDPDGGPHGVSAWTMGFPEEMAMEIPVGIPIPMQIHTHGDSIPAEMRRGHLSSHWDPNGSSIPAGMPVVSGAGPPRARGRPGRGASPGTFEPARESCWPAADPHRDFNEYPHGEFHGDPMRTMDFPLWTLPWRFLRRSLFPRRPQWKFDSRGDAPGVCGGAAWGTGLSGARGQLWHLRARAGILLACSRTP